MSKSLKDSTPQTTRFQKAEVKALVRGVAPGCLFTAGTVTWSLILAIRGKFVEAFFYFYVLEGVQTFLIGVALLIQRPQAEDTVLQRFLKGKVRQVGLDDFWMKMRGWSSAFLGIVSYDICWPVKFFDFMTLFTRMVYQKRAESAVWAVLTETSPWSLFQLALYRLSFATFIYFVVRHPSIYSSGLAITGICAVTVEELANILSPSPLTEQLRRTTGSPLINLIFQACCDTLTLSICIVVLGRAYGGTGDIYAIAQVARELVSAPKLAIAEGQQILHAGYSGFGQSPLTHWLSLLLGLPLYGALISILVSKGLDSLKRNDEDYLLLAHRSIAHGRIRQALKMLDRLKARTWSSEDARARVWVMKGDVSAAVNSLKHSYRLNPDVNFEPTIDDIYFDLFGSWMVMPVEQRGVLCEAAGRAGISQSARVAIDIYTYAITKQEKELAGTKKDALPTILGKPIAMIVAKDWELAEAELLSFRPNTFADRWLQMTLLFQVALSRQQSEIDIRLAFLIWSEKHRNEYEALCQRMVEGGFLSRLLFQVFSVKVRELSSTGGDQAFVRYLDSLEECIKDEIRAKPWGNQVVGIMEMK